MSWTDPEVPMPPEGYGKFEVNVHSNDCYTAGGPSKLTGFLTMTDTHGRRGHQPGLRVRRLLRPERRQHPHRGGLPLTARRHQHHHHTRRARQRPACRSPAAPATRAAPEPSPPPPETRTSGTMPIDLAEESTATLPLPGPVPAGAKELTFTVHMTTGAGPTSPVTLPVQGRVVDRLVDATVMGYGLNWSDCSSWPPRPWRCGRSAALAAVRLAASRRADATGGRVPPSCVTTAKVLRQDPAVPRRAKIALLIAVLWVVSPIDLLPEFLPVIGPLDDVVAVILLLRYAARSIPRDTLLAAWPSDPRLLERLLGRPPAVSTTSRRGRRRDRLRRGLARARGGPCSDPPYGGSGGLQFWAAYSVGSLGNVLIRDRPSARSRRPMSPAPLAVGGGE